MTMRVVAVFVSLLLVSLFAGCASQPTKKDMVARLADGKKVAVAAAVGNEAEWLHMGLTVFENRSVYVPLPDGKVDRLIEAAAVAKLRSMRIDAVAAGESRRLANSGYVPRASRGPFSRETDSFIMDDVRAIAAAHGTDVVLVIARPRAKGEEGISPAALSANGITVHSRSFAGIKNSRVEVFGSATIYAIDVKSGREIFAAWPKRITIGAFPAEYSTSELAKSVTKYEDTIATLASKSFSEWTVKWLDGEGY